MKVATFIESGKMTVTEAPVPEIQKDTDAIIKIVRACVCGSDLWWFRGISKREPNSYTGHEAIGIVETVGNAVTKVKSGDFVIVPFTHGCGKCAACRAGFDGNCTNMEPGGNAGYQGEYLRFTNADWALIKIPGQPSDYSDDVLNSLLTLADVMATGTEDFAKDLIVTQVEEMWTRQPFSQDNLTLHISTGSSHDLLAVQEYLYNMLPTLFVKTN